MIHVLTMWGRLCLHQPGEALLERNRFSTRWVNWPLAESKALAACCRNWSRHAGVDLPDQGFIPNLVTRVFEHAGYSIDIKIVPWPQRSGLAKWVELDLVASVWRGGEICAQLQLPKAIAGK